MASLLMRRLGGGGGGKKLLVVTKRKDQEGKSKHTSIQSIADGAFQEKYHIGDKVMDSCHRHMEIRYATRKADNFKVVVKLRYKPGCFASSAEEREWRISTEFMLGMPKSEGIAELYEVCEDSKAFYIVTELAAGMDLFELLNTKRHFTVDAAREVIKPIIEAVAHMHENSAIHKDLKLENVVVDAGNGRIQADGWSPKSVKIIDFDTVEEWSPKSPKAKDVLGTDQYIAQEAYDGTYSPCSDVFSLGVILYRLVAGKFPFREEIFDDKPGENWVGCGKMKQIRNRLKMAKLDFTHENFRSSAAPFHPHDHSNQNAPVRELCERMLAYNEQVRPSAKDALLSEFFGGPGLPKASAPPGDGSSPKDFGGSAVKLPQVGKRQASPSTPKALK